MTEFDRKYAACLKQILDAGIEEFNARTQHRTKSIPGVHFAFDAGFPLLSLRRIPLRIFIAEQIWFLTGSRKPDEFLGQYTKIWDDFARLDGVVSTAYGFRWRQHFQRDQIQLLVELLEKDPTSRHGVVIAWDPANDGLSVDWKKKNIPCPFAFTVNIIGGKLHLHNILRSNDMILGFPHDVAGFALLQRILAARLGVGVGVYSHSISNAHIYDIHYEAAKELLKRTGQDQEVELTAASNWLERAMSGDTALVDEIEQALSAQYTPESSIKGLSIVK